MSRAEAARRLGALLLFAAGVAAVFWPLLGAGLGSAVLRAMPYNALEVQDVSLTTYLVARNAHAITRRPHRIFEAEHCFPAPASLAFSDPLISLGLLGVPAELATGDPVVTYNLAMAGLLLLSAFGMYLLVRDWTGVYGAGLVAGLLYAFNPLRLGDISHPFIYDTSWTVLAILFARRLFRSGRWRDALGLGLCGALQLGTTLYPIVAALVLAAPLAVWLIGHYGLTARRVAQLGAVAAIVGLAAAWIFTPYLELRSGGFSPPWTVYARWSDLGPGGRWGPAWIAALLALAGLLARREAALGPRDGDPRWAVLVGTLLAAAVSTEALYPRLASVAPGLDLVRVPALVAVGVQLGAALLGGIGAAALLRRLPGRGPWVAGGLVAAVLTELLLAPALRAPEGRRFHTLELRPSPEELKAFEAIAELGDRGALLELPLLDVGSSGKQEAIRSILHAAYHHHATTACFGSMRSVPADEQSEGIRNLLQRSGSSFPVRELAELGYSVVLVDASTPDGESLKRLLDAEADAGRGVERVHQRHPFAAYSLPGPGA